MRPRPSRGGSRGDGGLSPGLPAELRPALDAALDTARAGLRETPPVDPPRLLRRLLNFAKLNNQALETIRRSLDDDGFRARVALAAGDEDALGRPSWLLIHRPEGWEDELAALTAPGAEPRADGPEARDLRRRLERTEAALEKAQAQLASAKLKAAQAAERASASSRDKRNADTELGRVRARLKKVEDERDRAEQRAEQQAAAVAAGAAAAAERPSRAAAEPPGAEAAPPDPWAGVDRAEVASRLSAITASVTGLAQQLAELAGMVTPAPPARSSRKAQRAPAPRRQPAPMPPAVFDTALDAGDHLLKNGVLLLVDGYNMTISSWPGMAIPDQRDRLVDALCELALRTHADVHVVFDGAQVQPAPVAPPRAVRVSFTPEDVEADDRILELIDAEPVARTVVVASDDGRVRRGATDRGANVLTGPQLFHSMRRER